MTLAQAQDSESDCRALLLALVDDILAVYAEADPVTQRRLEFLLARARLYRKAIA